MKVWIPPTFGVLKVYRPNGKLLKATPYFGGDKLLRLDVDNAEVSRVVMVTADSGSMAEGTFREGMERVLWPREDRGPDVFEADMFGNVWVNCTFHQGPDAGIRLEDFMDVEIGGAHPSKEE